MFVEMSVKELPCVRLCYHDHFHILILCVYYVIRRALLLRCDLCDGAILVSSVDIMFNLFSDDDQVVYSYIGCFSSFVITHDE